MAQLILPGTANPADVRASKTFSGGTNYGAQGSMTEYSGTKYTPTAAGILIPAGYHDGTTGTAAEPNLVAANIKSGVSIFGVAGSAGGLFASGTLNSTAGTYATLVVTGLSFKPRLVLMVPHGATTYTAQNPSGIYIQDISTTGSMFNNGSPQWQTLSITGSSVTSTGFTLACGGSGSGGVSFDWYTYG